MDKKFKISDLVWAKMKGYPHWPARVDTPPPDSKVPNNKYYVFFYGTLQYGWIPPSDLYSYVEYKDKFTKQSSMKGYSEALRQIEEDPTITVSSAASTPQRPKKKKPTSVKSKKAYTPTSSHSNSPSDKITPGSKGRKRHRPETPTESPLVKKKTNNQDQEAGSSEISRSSRGKSEDPLSFSSKITRKVTRSGLIRKELAYGYSMATGTKPKESPRLRKRDRSKLSDDLHSEGEIFRETEKKALSRDDLIGLEVNRDCIKSGNVNTAGVLSVFDATNPADMIFPTGPSLDSVPSPSPPFPSAHSGGIRMHATRESSKVDEGCDDKKKGEAKIISKLCEEQQVGTVQSSPRKKKKMADSSSLDDGGSGVPKFPGKLPVAATALVSPTGDGLKSPEKPPIAATALVSPTGDRLKSPEKLPIAATAVVSPTGDRLKSPEKPPIAATALVSPTGDRLKSPEKLPIAATAVVSPTGDRLKSPEKLPIAATTSSSPTGNRLKSPEKLPIAATTSSSPTGSSERKISLRSPVSSSQKETESAKAQLTSKRTRETRVKSPEKFLKPTPLSPTSRRTRVKSPEKSLKSTPLSPTSRRTGETRVKSPEKSPKPTPLSPTSRRTGETRVKSPPKPTPLSPASRRKREPCVKSPEKPTPLSPTSRRTRETRVKSPENPAVERITLRYPKSLPTSPPLQSLPLRRSTESEGARSKAAPSMRSKDMVEEEMVTSTRSSRTRKKTLKTTSISSASETGTDTLSSGETVAKVTNPENAAPLNLETGLSGVVVIAGSEKGKADQVVASALEGETSAITPLKNRNEDILTSDGLSSFPKDSLGRPKPNPYPESNFYSTSGGSVSASVHSACSSAESVNIHPSKPIDIISEFAVSGSITPAVNQTTPIAPTYPPVVSQSLLPPPSNSLNFGLTEVPPVLGMVTAEQKMETQVIPVGMTPSTPMALLTPHPMTPIAPMTPMGAGTPMAPVTPMVPMTSMAPLTPVTPMAPMTPMMFDEFSGSAAVEAVLSGGDHAMFELDSDIISLLNEVPDTMWENAMGGGGVLKGVEGTSGGEGRKGGDVFSRGVFEASMGEGMMTNVIGERDGGVKKEEECKGEDGRESKRENEKLPKNVEITQEDSDLCSHVPDPSPLPTSMLPSTAVLSGGSGEAGDSLNMEGKVGGSDEVMHSEKSAAVSEGSGVIEKITSDCIVGTGFRLEEGDGVRDGSRNLTGEASGRSEVKEEVCEDTKFDVMEEVKASEDVRRDGEEVRASNNVEIKVDASVKEDRDVKPSNDGEVRVDEGVKEDRDVKTSNDGEVMVDEGVKTSNDGEVRVDEGVKEDRDVKTSNDGEVRVDEGVKTSNDGEARVDEGVNNVGVDEEVKEDKAVKPSHDEELKGSKDEEVTVDEDVEVEEDKEMRATNNEDTKIDSENIETNICEPMEKVRDEVKVHPSEGEAKNPSEGVAESDTGGVVMAVSSNDEPLKRVRSSSRLKSKKPAAVPQPPPSATSKKQNSGDSVTTQSVESVSPRASRSLRLRTRSLRSPDPVDVVLAKRPCIDSDADGGSGVVGDADQGDEKGDETPLANPKPGDVPNETPKSPTKGEDLKSTEPQSVEPATDTPTILEPASKRKRSIVVERPSRLLRRTRRDIDGDEGSLTPGDKRRDKAKKVAKGDVGSKKVVEGGEVVAKEDGVNKKVAEGGELVAKEDGVNKKVAKGGEVVAKEDGVNKKVAEGGEVVAKEDGDNKKIAKGDNMVAGGDDDAKDITDTKTVAKDDTKNVAMRDDPKDVAKEDDSKDVVKEDDPNEGPTTRIFYSTRRSRNNQDAAKSTTSKTTPSTSKATPNNKKSAPRIDKEKEVLEDPSTKVDNSKKDLRIVRGSSASAIAPSRKRSLRNENESTEVTGSKKKLAKIEASIAKKKKLDVEGKDAVSIGETTTSKKEDSSVSSSSMNRRSLRSHREKQEVEGEKQKEKVMEEEKKKENVMEEKKKVMDEEKKKKKVMEEEKKKEKVVEEEKKKEKAMEEVKKKEKMVEEEKKKKKVAEDKKKGKVVEEEKKKKKVEEEEKKKKKVEKKQEKLEEETKTEKVQKGEEGKEKANVDENKQTSKVENTNDSDLVRSVTSVDQKENEVEKEEGGVVMVTNNEDVTKEKENPAPNAFHKDILNNLPPPILRVQTGMSAVEVLEVCNYNLKASLVVDGPNIHQALMTLRDLQELHCNSADLDQVPDLVYTLRKVRHYRPSPKIIKKAEEVYLRMKAMYIQPQSAPPPLTRRTLMGSRNITPTMSDYINKQSNRNSSTSKASSRQTTFKQASSAVTTPHDKKLPIDREKTTADDADRYNLGVTLLDSNEGIKDVIGQKPSMQAMKEMNTPLVPEGSKERTKTSGIVRMKNVGSPKKMPQGRALRVSSRTKTGPPVNYSKMKDEDNATTTTTTTTTSSGGASEPESSGEGEKQAIGVTNQEGEGDGVVIMEESALSSGRTLVERSNSVDGATTVSSSSVTADQIVPS